MNTYLVKGVGATGHYTRMVEATNTKQAKKIAMQHWSMLGLEIEVQTVQKRTSGS